MALKFHKDKHMKYKTSLQRKLLTVYFKINKTLNWRQLVAQLMLHSLFLKDCINCRIRNFI